MKITDLNESTIKRALETNKPVLISFFASWCSTCEQVEPLIYEFAEENPNIDVYRINVDENADIAYKYGVINVPSVLAVNCNQVKSKAVGILSKEEILELFG